MAYLGSGVWGSGFGAECPGFRVLSLGFGVRVHDLGFLQKWRPGLL